MLYQYLLDGAPWHCTHCSAAQQQIKLFVWSDQIYSVEGIFHIFTRHGCLSLLSSCQMYIQSLNGCDYFVVHLNVADI